MKYRELGNTGMKVSAVTLGTWVFGGECWGDVDDMSSIRVVEEAVEKGINFIDTAPVYGEGRSEAVVGKAVKGKRDSVYIATKCGLERKGHTVRPNLSASFIRQDIEASLRRLDTDYIDLYQCHWPDPNTSLKETFSEMNKLKDEGKIRHIGVSNYEGKELERVISLCDIVSDQVQYSLMTRGIEEELMPFCSGNDISILSYGSLGGGILTGKYAESPDLKRGDVRSFFYKFYTGSSWDKSKVLLKIFKYIAGKHNVPLSHIAINWVLRKSEVASCIVGCRNTEQLSNNIGAAEWSLDQEEIDLIEQTYRKVFC